MAKPRAIAYAEDVLEVHKVYQGAEGIWEHYNVALEDQRKARGNLRDYQEKLTWRETEISEELHAKALPSQAAFDRELKRLISNDEGCVQFNQMLNKVKDDLDEADLLVKTFGAKLKLLTARIEQLSGYFTYLAACKTAVTERYKVSDSPWS